MINIEQIVKADVAKLHSEINQFRNQEFWVCSFAIALFGATARFLPEKPILSFCVIVALCALYVWHYTLVATRGRLTTYLRVTKLSVWEINYRKFANRLSRPSQGVAALTTFMSLGILIPIVSGSEYIYGHYVAKTLSFKDMELLLYVVPTILYLSFVFLNSLRDSRDKLARYESEWRKVIDEKDWHAIAIVDDSESEG